MVGVVAVLVLTALAGVFEIVLAAKGAFMFCAAAALCCAYSDGFPVSKGIIFAGWLTEYVEDEVVCCGMLCIFTVCKPSIDATAGSAEGALFVLAARAPGFPAKTKLAPSTPMSSVARTTHEAK